VYQVEASDPDGDALSYTLVQTAGDASLDALTGGLTFHPSATGSVTFQIRVEDDLDGYATQTFTLDVVEPPVPSDNVPPEFTSRPTGPAYYVREIKGTHLFACERGASPLAPLLPPDRKRTAGA
jgi:hypothetical protein